MKPGLFVLFSFFVLCGCLRAQIGDRPGEAEEPLPAASHFAPEPALTPREELASFQVEPGFHLELVAAEPLVRDPVAAAYDWEGNLWVAEYTNYNVGIIKDLPKLAGGADSAQIPPGRIVKLESSRHDGHFDRRIVWLEGLDRPRGIAVVRGGILISDSPNLWLARDLHGSGHCDDKQLVTGGYEAWDDTEESGSLMWGRDNILHSIDFAFDYRYRQGKASPLPVPVRGQFGISQDDFGRIYSNRNSEQLFCDLFGPGYGMRNPHVTDLPWAFVRIADSQEVWPSHITPAVNRGYRRGSLGLQTGGLRDDATLLETTAACSPLIYRGANFPARYYGNAFVCEPSANLIKRDLLMEAEGRITAVNATEGREFLTSTDTRFRPVSLLNTPDGSLLVVDLYRGIFQEYHYITSYLSDQSLGRGLDRPMSGQGRLWKIVRDGGPLETKQPDFAAASPAELTAFLASANGWWRDSAQQEIVERGDRGAVPALEELARHGPSEVTRVAALWSLDGLEAATPALLREALADPSAKVRAAAVRIHERWLGGPQGDAMVAQLEAVLNDPAPEVSVQLALSLGEAKTPAALELMDRLLLIAGAHPFLPKAIASGLTGREWDFFSLLAGQVRQIGPRPEIKSMLAVLTQAVVHAGDPTRVNALLAKLGDGGGLPEWARLAALGGFEPLKVARFRRTIPAGLVLSAAALAPLAASADSAVRTEAAELVRGLARQEELTRERAAHAQPLTAKQRKYFEAGKLTFQVCAACHQPTGSGLAHVAPSLVDSHWVSGNPEILVRILQNGKEGTPGFPGAMPTIAAAFNDEQIAGLLTYIRSSWGLQAGAVAPDLVHRVRQQIATRQTAWTDAELKAVESELAQRAH